MIATYILILFAHVGAMGDGNSNAITTQEFNSKASCETAGRAAKRLVNSTVKRIEYVCTQK